MTEPRPFNREKFLLFLLAGIFIWQAAIFTFGTIGCFQKGGKDSCPDLGDRYENTVNVMVATTLALLGAGAVASQRKPSISSPSLPSSQEQDPLTPQRQVQESARGRAQESVQERVRGSLQGDRPGTVDRPYTKRG